MALRPFAVALPAAAVTTTAVILVMLSALTRASIAAQVGLGLYGGEAAARTTDEKEGDEILDRILNDVFKDVPEPRAGISRTTWVVSGTATASWSSYTSFTDSSFGGGVSEFFGAGGSITMQSTLNGESLDRYNALYPGFGSSGSWLMQPHQTKMAPWSGDRQVDEKKLMTQLWASVVLRDNIVTVLGYILNVPENPLTEELYTSLYHIYDAVRLRRVPTFELIRAVKELAGGSPNIQFLALFRAMRQVVPRYLQSAVSVWIDECRKDPKLLDDILRPGGGPLVVDFLAGIEASVIALLSEEIEWNFDSEEEQGAAVKLFGASVFEDVFTALQQDSLKLTQSLFAILLVNRPTNDVAAEKDEMERYLVDVLRLGNVEHWSEILEDVTEEDMVNPDRLIKKVLKLISDNKKIDPLVREDARYLRLYMRQPTVTYANKNYDVLSGVMSKPSIDILTLLKAISEKEYPNDIVKAKNRIVDYILGGQLNVEFITKGFNRFDHVTPLNILVALLTRINRRLPQLPKHVSQSVKTLQLFLLYKKFICTMSSTIPVSLMDASFVVNAYDDPSVPSNITDLLKELALTLPEENVPWEKVAHKVATNRCVRPRQCIYSFLCFIVSKKHLPKGRSTDIIKKLLKLLDRDGNPRIRRPLLSTARVAGEVNKTALATSSTASPVVVTTLELIQATVAPPVPEELYDNSTVASASLWKLSPDQRYLREVSEAAKRGRTFPFPALSAAQQEEPALVMYPATCLPPAVNGSNDYIKMLPAHMLLSWDRLPHFLGEDFHAQSNIKKGELLLNLMEKISKLGIIKQFEEVNLYVESFLQFIYSFKKTFNAESVIHFPSLLNALPAVKSDTERQYTVKLKNYFSSPEFYKQLGTRFNPRLHKTRGQMLKYVLTLMNSLPMVKWDPILKKSIDYYIGKVYTNGYGAQEVEWALLSEAAEPTYVDLTVFRVLDHSKMPQDALRAEYEIIRFIFTEFIPNVHLREFNVKQFKTKGQFLKGTFQYLLLQESVSPRVKDDIRLLMDFIRMDGRGSEPLDYNADIFN